MHHISLPALHTMPFQHTSPNLVNKAKKDIIREAKDEEHNIKDALKDLSRTEKAAHKASKVTPSPIKDPEYALTDSGL
jgi:hypothetical protein